MPQNTKVVYSDPINSYLDVLEFIKQNNLDPDKDEILFEADYSEVYYEGDKAGVRAFIIIEEKSK